MLGIGKIIVVETMASQSSINCHVIAYWTLLNGGLPKAEAANDLLRSKLYLGKRVQNEIKHDYLAPPSVILQYFRNRQYFPRCHNLSTIPSTKKSIWDWCG